MVCGIPKIDSNNAIESSRDYLRGIFVETARCHLEVVGDRFDSFTLASIPQLSIKKNIGEKKNFAGSIIGAADYEMVILLGTIYAVYERCVTLEFAF